MNDEKFVRVVEVLKIKDIFQIISQSDILICHSRNVFLMKKSIVFFLPKT